MLSSSQRKSFEYFLNKVCSFIVPSINRNFSEKTNIEYFVGKVTKIDELGIWYENMKYEKMNFIFYKNIICIAEEVVNSVEEEESEPLAS
jgi:hypothetical protein